MTGGRGWSPSYWSEPSVQLKGKSPVWSGARAVPGPVSFEMRLSQERDLARCVEEDIKVLEDCPPGWKYSVVVEDLDAFVALWPTLAVLRAAPPAGVTFRNLAPGETL